MRPSKNPPPPPGIYPPFKQLFVTLPESTPPSQSQNILPFLTTICDPLRIYPSLPEYTPIFNNYMRPSQNLPLRPKIYPLFNNYVRPSQNLHLPPRMYPLFNNYVRPSQNLPLLPRGRGRFWESKTPHIIKIMGGGRSWEGGVDSESRRKIPGGKVQDLPRDRFWGSHNLPRYNLGGGYIFRFYTGFGLFECYGQKIGLIFSKHNSVLVFLMGQNPECPGYN